MMSLSIAGLIVAVVSLALKVNRLERRVDALSSRT